MDERSGSRIPVSALVKPHLHVAGAMAGAYEMEDKGLRREATLRQAAAEITGQKTCDRNYLAGGLALREAGHGETSVQTQFVDVQNGKVVVRVSNDLPCLEMASCLSPPPNMMYFLKGLSSLLCP